MAPADQAAVGSGTAASAVQWNSIAVAGRQAFLLVSSVVLARVLGPETYGVISAATIYVTFTTLLLDQGLASALIQRPVLSRWAGGAVASANLVAGVLLAGLTVVVAPWVADFFRVEELTTVLRLLGLGLVVKSLAIAPRAMQARSLTFRAIAVADVSGAAAGAAAGVVAALCGAGATSIVFQVVTVDAVVATILLWSARGPVPNLRVSEVRALLPFGLRVMATDGIAYFSRNIDNILVGRVLGVVALSYYGMAYRVLVIPVQLVGQTVSRVMFPAFSRLAGRRELLADALVKATAMLAVVTVPAMGLLAVASPELVEVVLGRQWLPSAPLLTVLAVAGARETVLYVTGPLLKATGEVSLLVRYELLATAVQVAGIVVGLRWGVLGVAIGYTVAGFALSPVLLHLQRRLAGVTAGQQARAVLPPLHAALWGVAAYALVAQSSAGPALTLATGAAAYGAAAAVVLATVHRRSTARTGRWVLAVLPGRGRSSA
ncbi:MULTISPECIES: lipopolysaccharide biosynthesis protein [unclassified Actinotalea]|uniref:lipopolysaccharide biosynthesis protein n=1 Tax=unclassified Actinotalea TaxID=2638618 RepID=UPI0015F685D1|nr:MULTISPECIES: lipopolysaccharide biosynthesis protein [unclassified Actinotalea]